MPFPGLLKMPVEGLATIVGAVIGLVGAIVIAVVGPALGRYFLRAQKRAEEADSRTAAEITADQADRQRVSDSMKWMIDRLQETVIEQEAVIERLEGELDRLRSGGRQIESP